MAQAQQASATIVAKGSLSVSACLDMLQQQHPGFQNATFNVKAQHSACALKSYRMPQSRTYVGQQSEARRSGTLLFHLAQSLLSEFRDLSANVFILPGTFENGLPRIVPVLTIVTSLAMDMGSRNPASI